MRKSRLALFIAIFLAFTLINPYVSLASDNEEYDAVEVSRILDQTTLSTLKAKSAFLIDSKTGSILFALNEDERLPLASITKVMTMLVMMEAVKEGRVSMQDKVPVSEYSMGFGGSQVYLEPGEDFTLEEMLKAIAIHSANDASVAVAEKIAGSEEAFVQMMNERAEELNMKNTKFLDCSGLTDVGHYSTAKDIAIMSRELINNHPEILKYTSMWNTPFRDMELYNRNKLVRFYDGCNGLKTGFTNAAGHCISASAMRNGMQLIAVIMGCSDTNTRYAEARKLLDHGFANFELVVFEKKDTVVQEVEIKKGLQNKINAVVKQDASFLLKKGDKGKVNKSVEIMENLVAPIEAGQKIGEIQYTIEGVKTPLGKVDLCADSGVEKASVFKMFWIMMCNWFCLGRA